ncbi:hypothetical protein NEOC95_002298 [Neochlamydia sp. AcF95]|nr:hypothetical protein [Neochlamydia sp. AcF95]
MQNNLFKMIFERKGGKDEQYIRIVKGDNNFEELYNA